MTWVLATLRLPNGTTNEIILPQTPVGHQHITHSTKTATVQHLQIATQISPKVKNVTKYLPTFQSFKTRNQPYKISEDLTETARWY